MAPVVDADAASSAQEEACVPLSSCMACSGDEMLRPYCSKSGMRREVRCWHSPLNATDGMGADVADTYPTFQSCESGFSALVRFELLMVVFFIASFSIATKQKRRLHARQRARLAERMQR